MIKCKKCGKEFQDGTKFCSNCGNQIVKMEYQNQNAVKRETKNCKYCQSKVDINAKYCPNCHRQLGLLWYHYLIGILVFLWLTGILPELLGF